MAARGFPVVPRGTRQSRPGKQAIAVEQVVAQKQVVVKKVVLPKQAVAVQKVLPKQAVAEERRGRGAEFLRSGGRQGAEAEEPRSCRAFIASPDSMPVAPARGRHQFHCECV